MLSHDGAAIMAECEGKSHTQEEYSIGRSTSSMNRIDASWDIDLPQEAIISPVCTEAFGQMSLAEEPGQGDRGHEGP